MLQFFKTLKNFIQKWLVLHKTKRYLFSSLMCKAASDLFSVFDMSTTSLVLQCNTEVCLQAHT